MVHFDTCVSPDFTFSPVRKHFPTTELFAAAERVVVVLRPHSQTDHFSANQRRRGGWIMVIEGEFIPMTDVSCLVRPLCQISEFRRIVGLEICFVKLMALRCTRFGVPREIVMVGFQGGSRRPGKSGKA